VQLLEPLVPDPGALLARTNPIAKIGAAAAFMVAAFVTIDLLTPTILLALETAVLPATGLRARALLGRLWPLGVAALGVGVLNALLAGDPTGELIFRFGPLVLTTGSLLTGVALAVRLLVIALAGVLAFVATDPTDFADGLTQQLHVSPRIAIGSLAGLRALPILAEEWQTIGLAQRARGVEAGRSPIAAVRQVASRLLTLLVRAIRRGIRMATAMEARGFGASDCRTVARPQRMRGRDWGLLAAALLASAAATTVSVALGSWRFVFS
jgi:energy-coupling factor transport system permease protein